MVVQLRNVRGEVKTKVKIRHIAAIVIILASMMVTPFSIVAAYQLRGYKAYGGEYLVIPLGILLAVALMNFAKLYDGFRHDSKPDNLESEE